MGVLLDQQDREALPVQLLDQGEELFDEERRKAQRRLVQHHQLRPADQGAADGEHLLLAAREHRRLHVPTLGEVREAVVDCGDVLLDPRRVAAQVAAHQQVLVHGHRDEDLPALGDQHHARADPLGRARIGQVAAHEADGAAGGFDRALQRAQQRGLAGPVGAEDGDDLALADRQRDAADGVGAAIRDVEGLGLQPGLRHGRAPSRRRGGGRGRPPAPAGPRAPSRRGRRRSCARSSAPRWRCRGIAPGSCHARPPGG